ncbi:SDR family oxidoreductase [Rhodospirillaceae bacterium KN72]|uniref:SDR family oxidoreductase n=1 Tax=Pacificispira spongiicola TaxID=2729598 RepID=A0A7Y0E0H6_9PROT|nr:SDR family oxidoreductase [Pacificispira spongiicola]NMM44974.1 SDR family oxidoreductase [Pacificispira spongiicola]
MTRPVAVVTGGSRGIGAACCRLLARRGYDVAFSYQSDTDAAAGLVAELQGAGARALAVQANMAREIGITTLFETVDRELGLVSRLVVNAGITGKIQPVAEMSAEEIEAVIGLNVTGAILAAREGVRRMSTDRNGLGGSIVFLSSAAAWIGSPNEFVHYAASKGAVNSLTIGLAKEVARQGIRVNAVAPGLIDTDIHATAGAPDRIARLQDIVPMGRGGSAEEVAEGILWLLSDQASYVTGSILPISGGR